VLQAAQQSQLGREAANKQEPEFGQEPIIFFPGVKAEKNKGSSGH